MNRKLQFLVDRLKKIDYKSYPVSKTYNVVLKPYGQKTNYTKEFKDLLKIVSSVSKLHKPKKIFEKPKKIFEKPKKIFEKPTEKVTNKQTLFHLLGKKNILHKNVIFERIKTKLDGYILKVRRGGFDCYSELYFKTLDNELCILPRSMTIQHLKNIKYNVVENFNKHNLYKINNFSSKDFKKSDIDDVFANNKNITFNMLKIYGIVFQTNIIYIDKNDIQFMTNFIPNRVSIILTEDNDYLYSIKIRGVPYIRGERLMNILDINRVIRHQNINSFNLKKLQNLCKMKNMDYRKMGKTKKINKTKEELVKELCNIN